MLILSEVMRASPLRVGVVGCGNIGLKAHLPAWLGVPELATVVGLVDPNLAALEAGRAVAGLSPAQVHAEAGNLLARSDVDVVDVCTPQHARRDLLVDAVKAGKHVLCEKPLATVPSDARAAVDAAERCGVTFGIVHNFLWLPEIRAALDVLRRGEIGAVRVVSVNYLGVVDVPDAAGTNWRHQADLAGGGVLMDMVHAVYVAEALLGAPIRRVSAYVDRLDPDATVEDLALCRFETDENVALVNIGWGHGPGGIDITGRDGRITIRYRGGATAPWAPLEHVAVTTDEGTRIVLAGNGGELQDALPTSYVESFDGVIDDFARAVLSGRAPTATARDGLHMLEATLGAYESAALNATVTLPE